MKWKTAIICCQSEVANARPNETAIQVLREMIEEDLAGFIEEVRIVEPEVLEVSAAMYELIDYTKVELLFTLGGIGIDTFDIVPEATMRVIERPLPGLSEAMRASAMAKDATAAMLNRGVVGIKGHALIVNLPANPEEIMDNMQLIVPAIYSALRALRG